MHFEAVLINNAHPMPTSISDLFCLINKHDRDAIPDLI